VIPLLVTIELFFFIFSDLKRFNDFLHTSINLELPCSFYYVDVIKTYILVLSQSFKTKSH